MGSAGALNEASGAAVRGPFHASQRPRRDPLSGTRIASISGLRTAIARHVADYERTRERSTSMRACSCATVACETAGPAAHAAQLGVDHSVRVAGLARVQPHQAVQQLPLLLERAVQRLRRGGLCAGTLAGLARPAVPALAGLPLLEELVHVLGLEQSRQAQELLLLGRSRHRELPELRPS